MTRKKIQSNHLKSLSLALAVVAALVLAIFYHQSNPVAAQDLTISLDTAVSFPVDI